MDKIIIKDLLVRGIVGVNPDERTKKQDVVVNVVMHVDTRQAGASDDIEEAVNYRTVSKRVIEHVEETSRYLVESLASDIARIIVTEFEVARVQVRIEKPGALRYAQSVGVEIERTPDDYRV
jgi:FolB domain-containing protein